MKKRTPVVLPPERIQQAILYIRGHKVMLDFELAEIFGTTTKRLNEQVKRNIHRFPKDFMFLLTIQEVRDLKSQFATSSWGGRRKQSYAFTEHGAVMLASVLNTDIAINASVQIVRTYLRMREMISANKDLGQRLDTLERKYDAQFKVVFNSIKELINPKVPVKPKIGFKKE